MRRLGWLIPLLYILFLMVPIYWLLSMSFKTTNEILGSFTLWPRNFTLDPTGAFLLVANQRTDNVVVFSIDRATGRLKPAGHVEEIPSPVCLKFL